MPVKKLQSTLNVLEAAKLRIKNVFANGCKVYLSFSSGKDSLCMSSITYDLIRSGEINPKQLTVIFVDEEGLYPSMVEAAERWHCNFQSVGVPFLWLCLPFKQVSVIHLRKLDYMGAGQRRFMDPPAPSRCDPVQPISQISRTDELSDLL